MIGVLVTVVLAPIQLFLVLMIVLEATDGFESSQPPWVGTLLQSFWLLAVIGGASVLLMVYGIAVWIVRDLRSSRAHHEPV